MGQRLQREESELPKPKRKSKKAKEVDNTPPEPIKKVEVGKATWIELPASISPENEAKRVAQWRKTHGVILNDKGFHKNLI